MKVECSHFFLESNSIGKIAYINLTTYSLLPRDLKSFVAYLLQALVPEDAYNYLN